MQLSLSRRRAPLFFALFSGFLGIFAAACNADIETVCHDGACEGTTGGGTTATTGKGGSGGSGGAGGTGGTGGGMMCSTDPETGDFPCDVHAIIQAKCQNCHADPHVGGAPIDFLACERFHETDCSGQKSRLETAQQYVSTGFMPLGANKLTADEKQLLLDWLSACAPCEAAGTGCGDAPGTKACFEL